MYLVACSINQAKWNSYKKKTRMENRSIDPAVKRPTRQGGLKFCSFITAETVPYNGPVLSGQFSKSRFFSHTNAVFVTWIRQPPLLSSRGHPVAVLLRLSSFVILTCIRRPPLLSGCVHPVEVLHFSFVVIFTCIKLPPLNGN